MKFLIMYLYVAGIGFPAMAWSLYLKRRWDREWLVERFRVMHQKLDDIKREQARPRGDK